MNTMRAALVALLAFSGLAVGPTPAMGQQPCAQPVAYLTKTDNSVQLTRVSTKTATAIGPTRKVPLCAGDRIEVGDNASAFLELSGTSVKLDQNTSTVVQAPPVGGSTLIELLRGALFYVSRVRRPIEIR